MRTADFGDLNSDTKPVRPVTAAERAEAHRVQTCAVWAAADYAEDANELTEWLSMLGLEDVARGILRCECGPVRRACRCGEGVR